MFVVLRPRAALIFVLISLAGLLLISCSANDSRERIQPAANGRNSAFTDSTEIETEVSASTSGAGFDMRAAASAKEPEEAAALAGTAIQALKLADAFTDRKNDKVIKDYEDYDAARMPLLSALPDKGIYLYGIKEFDGVMLFAGEDRQYFDWQYLTPRFILPQMQTGDFDADGKDELAVILYIGSGTGVSIEDLHIVELSGEQNHAEIQPAVKDEPVLNDQPVLEGRPDAPKPDKFIDHSFNTDDYVAQLRETVSFKTVAREDELTGLITIGKKIADISLKDYQAKEYGKIDDILALGSIVHFSMKNGKLTAEFGAGITSNTFVSPQYIGTLKADVKYKDEKFILKNLHFQANQE